ncbi:methionine--tRNA ligase [Candidatus Dependentiae bacterium]|nr:methionine--tRNA ligase [Candidatus Dependentiae bacterium]
MASENKFYVTTPIYYVTARPHLGSLYSTLLADVAARWNKLYGKKTFFLTGTDEHGQKIAEAAEKAGKKPKDFVDSFIESYQGVWNSYEIQYNHFIRTTDKGHAHGVQEWIKYVQKKGDIYKANYQGWYCVSCETFLTESEAKDFKGEYPACPTCGRQTKYISEESYFFKLSSYQDKLLKFYEDNPNFITPKERLNEVVSFVKSGLKDLSISRTTVRWGIPFPGDPKHVVYVWADALNNYLTAIGYQQPGEEKEFNFWWPADLQILGKDIVRFHAVYWPAFLMAADLALPKKLLVHGWIKVGQQKMSKSLGNVIDPQNLLDAYGAEPVRYYLCRHMSIAQDSEFSVPDLEQKINSDLANDLGNLLNRTITLALKNELGDVTAPKTWSKDAIELKDKFSSCLTEYTADFNEGFFNRALTNLWHYINNLNSYFQHNEPWSLAKADKQKFAEVISATCHGLYGTAILLWPIMPKKMTELLDALNVKLKVDGQNYIEQLKTLQWNLQFKIKQIEPLFKKIEHAESPKMTEDKSEFNKKEPDIEPTITIDDFLKVKLLVGTVEQCEPIQGSDKLLKLQVDFGKLGKRQILSGIKQLFSPEELLNKQFVFVFNLAPRKMMGLESQGMLLITKDDQGKAAFITPSVSVSNGSRLQ